MDINRGSEQWWSKLVRVINSTVCFSMAYIMITFLHWMTLSSIGKFFKFDSFVYYYGIKFVLNGAYWNRLNVSFIYGGGTLFFLLFGLFSLYLYDKLRNFKSVLNLFFIWGFIIGTTLFCVQIIVAAIGYGEYNSPFYQGLAVVFAWVRIPIFIVYALVIPFAILFAYFVVHYGKPVLRLAYSFTRVNKLSRRRMFFLETIIVPFLIGSVGVTALTFPMNLFIHLTYMVAILVAIVGTYIAMPYIEVLKDDVLRYKNLQKLNYVFIVVLGLMVMFVIVTFKGLFMSAT
ncbi:MAG: hypothetical protein IPH78_00570 [Bacteroidetes bacterium]|nr:hypothetical protein [Bacteroidota bacterium]